MCARVSLARRRDIYSSSTQATCTLHGRVPRIELLYVPRAFIVPSFVRLALNLLCRPSKIHFAAEFIVAPAEIWLFLPFLHTIKFIHNGLASRIDVRTLSYTYHTY